MWRPLRFFASRSLNERCLTVAEAEKYKVRDPGVEMVLQLSGCFTGD